jgi:biopolymer transport protein ExbD
MVMKLKRKRPITAIELASTGDVAFLLLIFFIVSTAFATDFGLPLLLPAKDSAVQAIKIKQSNIATLKVHADNHISLDGKPIEVNAIKSTVERRLQAQPKLVVVLETHPDADYGKMVACLDELKLANARRVSLKTSKG